MIESMTDQQRAELWRSAIESFGTAYIFEKRAAKFRGRMRLLAFSGIVLPLTVGAVAGAFGAGSSILAISIVVAGVLGVFQLGLSAWAISAKWDDSLGYSQESTTDNYRLSKEFATLAKLASTTFQLQLAILEAQSQSRDAQDQRQDISDPEKRMGLRAALRQFERKCVKCEKVPDSMEPTDCPVCGKF